MVSLAPRMQDISCPSTSTFISPMLERHSESIVTASTAYGRPAWSANTWPLPAFRAATMLGM